MQLKGYQVKAVQDLYEQADGLLSLRAPYKEKAHRGILRLVSGVGSGKTVMSAAEIGVFLKRNPDWAVLWLSPSQGGLNEQSLRKLVRIIGHSVPVGDYGDVGFKGLPKGSVTVVGLASFGSAGGKKRKSVETASETQDDIFTAVDVLRAAGGRLLVVVDESHYGAKDGKSLTIILTRMLPDLVMEMSATPDDNLVRALEAACRKAGLNLVRSEPVVVPVEDVVAAGMMKRQLHINDGVWDLIRERVAAGEGLPLSNDDFETVLIEAAYLRHYRNVDLAADSAAEPLHPLCLIQIDNDTKYTKATEAKVADIRRKVAALDAKHSRTSTVREWLGGRISKAEKEDLTRNGDPTDFLVFKQAIALGWDCPRADSIVKLREFSKSEAFEEQTVGRIMRTAEQRHYGNELDEAYLYSEYLVPDEEGRYGSEAVQGLFALSGSAFGGAEAAENVIAGSVAPKEGIERVLLPGMVGDLISRHGLAEAEGRIASAFVAELHRSFQTRSDATLAAALTRAATADVVLLDGTLDAAAATGGAGEISVEARRVSVARSEDEVRTGYLKAIRTMPSKMGIDPAFIYENSVTPTIEELVGDVAEAVRVLEANMPIILTCLERAIAAAMGEMARDEAKSTFVIAEDGWVAVPPDAFRTFKDGMVEHAEYRKFAYERCYLLKTKAERIAAGLNPDSPHFRSLAEAGTEAIIDGHESVIWWLKNGDRGSDYFSIPYIDDSSGSLELRDFYPDYIVLLERAGGGRTVAVIEAKREEEQDHNVRQTECKASWLQRYLRLANEYAAAHGEETLYVGGIVRVVPEGHRYTGTRINTTPDWSYDESHMFSLEEFLTDAAK